MKYFNIRQLENLSNIKAHTIRMWENRYQVLKPKRSPGNTRYYTVEDVERLLNIAFLNQRGKRISTLTRLNQAELVKLLESFSNQEAKDSILIDRLLIALYSEDVDKLETILDSALADYGLNNTIHNIIVPFLEKANILSYKDSGHETHFAVTVIRKKLIFGIESITQSVNSNKKALLFLPLGEHYDLILLYMTYILKSNGIKVYYLGTNISMQNIQTVATSKSIDYLYVYITPGKQYQFEDLANFLSEHLPDTELLIVSADDLIKKPARLKNVSFIHFRDVCKGIQAS